REDGDRVPPEVVGSTERPAAELAVRHRHVIAHSRAPGAACAAYLRRDRLDDPRRPSPVSGRNRPKPARASQTPQPVSRRQTDRGSGSTAARIMQFIVLERGFEGARLDTGAMSDLPTLAATILANLPPRYEPRV